MFKPVFKPFLFSLVLLSNFGFGFGSFSFSEDRLLAQNPPAKTFQEGFWQPVSRVDLEKPIKLYINNVTNIAIAYDITESKGEPVSILPSRVVRLKNVEPALYISIYPNSNKPNNSQINLKYQVDVTEDNIVVVNIFTTGDGTESNRSLNLHETGAIYLY